MSEDDARAQLAHLSTKLQCTLSHVGNEFLTMSQNASEIPAIECAIKKILQALKQLETRINKKCVNVMVVGTCWTEKKCLINAILGMPCMDVNENSLLSSTLTIESGNYEDCQLFSIDDTGVAESIAIGSPWLMQQTVNYVNDNCKNVNLIMKAPPTPYAQDAINMTLICAPEATMGDLHESSQTIVNAADVVVVVMDFKDQSQKDAGLWSELMEAYSGNMSTPNVLVFISNYEQDITSETCQNDKKKYQNEISKYTNHQLNLPLDQIIFGSTRKAMLARVIFNANCELTSECDELVTEAMDVFSIRNWPRSIEALQNAIECEDELDCCGWMDFDAALQVKSRVCAITHLFKLAALVGTSTSCIGMLCSKNLMEFEQEVLKCQNQLLMLAGANSTINKFFEKEALREDGSFIKQLEAATSSSLETCKKAVITALNSATTTKQQIPVEIPASNNAALEKILGHLNKTLESAMLTEMRVYKAKVQEFCEKRESLVPRSQKEVAKIFTTYDVTPVDFASNGAIANISTALEKELSSWMKSRLNVDSGKLAHQIKKFIQNKQIPGAFYQKKIDLSTRVCAQFIRGRFSFRAAHHILNDAGYIEADFAIESKFIGHGFVLEMHHLTSDAGALSFAPVTVTVNGSVIRSNFDPRRVHEQNDNKVGLWHCVADRWRVDSQFVKPGVNVVKIALDPQATSCYWIQRFGLECRLPTTSAKVIRTSDIVNTLKLALLDKFQMPREMSMLSQHILESLSVARALLHVKYQASQHLIDSKVEFEQRIAQAKKKMKSIQELQDHCVAAVKHCNAATV